MSDDATDYIGQGTTDKHLLLLVPDYEDVSDSAGRYQPTKNTYLNLGHGSGDPNHAEPTWYPAAWDASGLNPNAVEVPSTTGDDLLSFFGGFVDDTRARGTGTTAGGTFAQPGATPPSEVDPRNGAAANTADRNGAVTAAIPDYLGWRDHTDGHRITTTRGDKIEIIGGNYKLVSLGRGTGVATFEMSGGLNVGGDEAPGAVTSVSWVECPTEDFAAGTSGPKKSGWQVVEQTVKGNTVERFHGTKREEFYGDVLISVTGSPTFEKKRHAVIPRPDSIPAGAPNAQKTYAVATPHGAEWDSENLALPTQWDSEGGAPDSLDSPDIHEATWAKHMRSYTHADAITNQLEVFGNHREKVRYIDGDCWSEVHMKSEGARFCEWWRLGGSQGFFEFFEGAKTEYFFGATTTIGFANRFECFFGVEEQVNLGASLGLAVTLAIDISLGVKVEAHFGKSLECASEADKFWGGEFVASGQESKVTLSSMKAALTRKSVAVVVSSNAAVTNIGP